MKTKRLYQILTMLTLVFGALMWTSCGGDDDEIDGGEDAASEATLTINDKKYYPNRYSTIEESKKYYDTWLEDLGNHGMYFKIYALESKNNYLSGKVLTLYISRHSKVSQLTEGEVFDINSFRVREMKNYNEIVINAYNWNEEEGNFCIESISNFEVKIRINNLKITSNRETNAATRIINGTVVLRSTAITSDGEPIPFF